MAINLGVLSNFIESSYGDSFKQLRKYVINSNLLTNQLNEKGYEENSAFQHVSFLTIICIILQFMELNQNIWSVY